MLMVGKDYCIVGTAETRAMVIDSDGVMVEYLSIGANFMNDIIIGYTRDDLVSPGDWNFDVNRIIVRARRLGARRTSKDVLITPVQLYLPDWYVLGYKNESINIHLNFIVPLLRFEGSNARVALYLYAEAQGVFPIAYLGGTNAQLNA